MSIQVQVKSSPIHGLGVFASTNIRKGTTIGTYEGEVSAKDGTYVLWVGQEDGSEVGIEGHNDLRYLNHSSEPNCEFDGDELHALQRIAAGSELTFHYGDAWMDEG